MVGNIMSCGILALSLLPAMASSQVELSLAQSLDLFHEANKSLRIAGKEVAWAKSERQKMQAYWYPSLRAQGAYVHLSNPVEARQSFRHFTEPAKTFLHNYIADNSWMVSLLDQVGQGAFSFPLIGQHVTAIDATLSWPIFTGGRRFYAGQVGRLGVALAETNRNQVEAEQLTRLVETYFGLRLGVRVVEVRAEASKALRKHYEQALLLERSGLINRAERLFAQVSLEEADRALDDSRRDLSVASQAFNSLIGQSDALEVRVTTPLFIDETLPAISYFKNLILLNNYLVSQLELQRAIVQAKGKIDRAAYFPTIALWGKQTLYAEGIDKHLLPRTWVGVGFTWNLFDGLNREKNIRQARIAGQSLCLWKEKAISDLEVGIDQLYNHLQKALDNVRALRTSIEMSSELVRVRRRSFQEGLATSTEVVDAEVLLAKVKTAALMAYYEYDVALIHLLSVCGLTSQFMDYLGDGHKEELLDDEVSDVEQERKGEKTCIR